MSSPIHAKIHRMSRFVTIRRGWFLMGSHDGQSSERPVRRIWADAFQMAVYPVTRSEYARFLAQTAHPEPREWNNLAFGRDDQPAVGVSWHDAQAYCAWRSRHDDGGAAPERSRMGTGGPRRPGWSSLPMGRRYADLDSKRRARPPGRSVARHAGTSQRIRVVWHCRKHPRVVLKLARPRVLRRGANPEPGRSRDRHTARVARRRVASCGDA